MTVVIFSQFFFTKILQHHISNKKKIGMMIRDGNDRPTDQPHILIEIENDGGNLYKMKEKKTNLAHY